MTTDTPSRIGPRPGHSCAADYAACARAEYMLRCYGVAYACRHPEQLISGSAAIAFDRPDDSNPHDLPYNPSNPFAPVQTYREYAVDDVLTRIIGTYQALDDIFKPDVPSNPSGRLQKNDDSGGQR